MRVKSRFDGKEEIGEVKAELMSMQLEEHGLLVNCKLAGHQTQHAVYLSYDETREDVVIHDLAQLREISSRDGKTFMKYFASLLEKEYYTLSIKKEEEPVAEILTCQSLNLSKKEKKMRQKDE